MPVSTKDIWNTLKGLFLEQYRGDLRQLISEQGGVLPEGADNRFQGLLKAVVDVLLQPIDDAVVASQNLANLDDATGEWLDTLGLIAGLKRNYEETDANFRTRIRIELSSDNAGTPDNVIYNAALLSGDQQPLYMDEAPATFLVYDGPRFDENMEWGGGGRIQLSRAQVKKMAPAGVLGLPGAAILLPDDFVFTTYDEDPTKRKLILAAAYDDTIEREVVLADNNGTVMMTAQSTPIRVTLQGSQVADIPVIETEWNGVPVDAVRIKDLPDAGYDSAYMVRDSSAGGTTKIDEGEVGLQMQPSGTNTLRFFKRT